MSFDDDRERFQLRRGNMANFARWKMSNYLAGQADIARCQDHDLEAAAKFTAAARAPSSAKD